MFTIRVTGVHSGTGKTTEGSLNFVDLIASDSHLEATKVESSDSKDSVKTLAGGGIDQSLKCLADVFLALSNKDSQAPYRGSKVKRMGSCLYFSRRADHVHFDTALRAIFPLPDRLYFLPARHTKNS